MSGDLAQLLRALSCSALVMGLASATGVGSALGAEAPTVDEIIQSLTPKHLTRSLDSLTAPTLEPATNPEETLLIDKLRKTPTPFITPKDREALAKFEQNKPGNAFEIDFEYNSSRIAPSAMTTARNIGEALTSANLKGSTFVIEGHTDAKGGDRYNQILSERRAITVKRFLVDQYKIPATDLLAVGYGKTHLMNPDDAFGAENRRVRIINTEANVANK